MRSTWWQNKGTPGALLRQPIALVVLLLRFVGIGLG